jgi:hypothetical protein
MDKRPLIDYLHSVSNWRTQKAAAYPDDPRNQRCAEGLEELIAHIWSLSADDEDLRVLWNTCVVESNDGTPDIFLPGLQLSYDVGRFRFDSAEGQVGTFVGRMAGVSVRDKLEWGSETGSIE